MRRISRKNFIFGIVNLIIPIPIFFGGLATVEYITYNKSKSFFSCVVEFIFNPWLFPLIFLVLMNSIVDYIVYRNLKKNYLKKILMVLNLIYIFSITVRFYNSPPVVFFIGFLSLFLYKTFRYYQYYKITTIADLD